MPFERVKHPKVTVPGPGEPSQISDRSHLKPTNERLWNMLVTQAKAKFMKWPSPNASAWVHEKYVKMGGKFVDTHEEAKKKRAVKAASDIMEARREARAGKHHGRRHHQEKK